MTEASYPVKTLHGHDYIPASLLPKAPLDFEQHHGVVAMEIAQEDDGQISCVCGYYDDDGWTVACDSCNKWQHQLCYYPDYEDQSLPDDLQHYCIDCRPNSVDVHRARDRQRERREQQHRVLVNGVKRQPAAKSHKKKVKETAYTNGWPVDKARHDRNSASPRDLPPPAKRPKTSHRSSDSIAKGHSRKRTVINVGHQRSLSRSPDCPFDLYSEEFLRCYKDDRWTVANANLHDSIAIANVLPAWLTASEDEFRETHGQEKGKVLMRWDGDIEAIPGKPQLEVREVFDDRVQDEDSKTPTWRMITVTESVAPGAFIGELKGHVGFKEEYQQDQSNRWPQLRHPEPFVFFHPQLPIYIDARNEGTELRYVRRSCRPNARLQILVTGGTTYHFCFMATEQIDPGMEIAVGWDVTDSLPELMRRGEGSLLPRDMDKLSSWVSTVLANCGPCACQPYELECLMARFDRRGSDATEQDDESSSIKGVKPKKRKSAPHISPLNTNFTSRSGSEARKAEHDDEHSDSRSMSGSAGRGSASRDITPNTHYSHTGSLSTAPELSERERKKLAKEEEMFRRQEEEKNGKTGKKKRTSGGSSLNTPSATSSKQLGFPGNARYADAGTSKQTSLPSAKPGRKPKSAGMPKTPAKVIYKTVKRPKPDYVDSEVQCDMDKEEAERRAKMSPPRRPFLSTTQRLLHRCALNNARRKSAMVTPPSSQSAKSDDVMDVDQPSATSPTVSHAELSILKPSISSTSAGDTEMKDAESATSTSSPHVETVSRTTSNEIPPPPVSHVEVPPAPIKDESAPPWPPPPKQSIPSLLQVSDSNRAPKPLDMHLQMPPPPTNPFSTSSAPSTGTPTMNGPITQSPATIGGPSWLSSPSVTAAVTPSPAKKKMSLSEYTKRSKPKDKENEPRAERDSSPASVASGPVVAPFQASDSVKAATMAGSAVEDDVKMEDFANTAAARV